MYEGVCYSRHTNVFLTMGGMPYILAEYTDDQHYQELDTSVVKTEVVVDQSESMRSVIDISIDDIGRNPSTGRINVIGNTTKFESLIDMIRRNYANLDHQLPMIKRGLVVRVNYQIENNETGQVMRTAVESLRIPNRYYFFVVNPDDINDNAIVTNFCDSIVSTINQFTHGTEPMRLRITSIQLSYEMVRQNPLKPRVTQRFEENIPSYAGPADLATNRDLYNYHEKTQSRQSIGGYYQMPVCGNYYNFNTFYHFSENNDDIILHEEEINDKHAKITMIPCGQIQVNRTFMINPGTRLVFKFSIWKNDGVIVNSCVPIADALRIPPSPVPVPPTPQPLPPETRPYPYPPYWPYPPYPPFYPYPSEKSKEFELLMKILDMNKDLDKKQDIEIRELAKAIKELKDIIDHKPHPVPPGPHPHPHPMPPSIKAIMEMLKDLQQKMDEVIEKTDIELSPISDEYIQEIINALEADYEDDHEYDGSVPYPDTTDTTEEGEDNGETPIDPDTVVG